MKKRILFIINPISGGRSKLSFPHLAETCIDHTKFDTSYRFTEYAGHAYSLSREGMNEADIIVAVGGDGTINEVASAIEGTSKVMGIIPCGSGNGLARYLGIPLNHEAAVTRLNRQNVTVIDSGMLNSRKFFNMAGMGFDAHISAIFAKKRTRGFQGYVKTTLSEIIRYQPESYIIEVDGHSVTCRAFMLSIANSSQYGNNAFVSPKASANDGLLDICIIRPFPLYHFPVMVFRMFSKSAEKSKYVEIIRGQKIRIIREKPGAVHLDGEPEEMGTEVNIEISPLSVRILT